MHIRTNNKISPNFFAIFYVIKEQRGALNSAKLTNTSSLLLIVCNIPQSMKVQYLYSPRQKTSIHRRSEKSRTGCVKHVRPLGNDFL